MNINYEKGIHLYNYIDFSEIPKDMLTELNSY